MATFLVHHLLRDAVLRDPEAIAAVDARGEMSYGELDRRSDRVARALAAIGVPPRARVGLAVDKSLDAVVAIYGVLKAGCAYVPIDPLSPARRVAQILDRCDIGCVLISPGRIRALLAPPAETGEGAPDGRDEAAGAGAGQRSVSRALTHALTPTVPDDDVAALVPGVTVAAWDAIAGADRPDGARAGAPDGADDDNDDDGPNDDDGDDGDNGAGDNDCDDGHRLVPAPLAPPAVTEMDLAYILHTSGSTGAPKGVAITHHGALAFVSMAADYFAISSDDRVACHAPLHFDLSVFDLLCAAAAGARAVLLPPHLSAFPGKLTAWIDDHGITVWSSVASALALMVDRGQLDRRSLASLRVVIFSGEPMPIRVLRALRERLPRAAFYNVYGQTEANSSMCYRVDELPDDDAAALPIGAPFPNFEVFAIDAGGRVLGPDDAGTGAEGELHVRAATVAAGYFRDPDRTADRFVPDPRDPVTGGRVYRTGDLVAIDDRGRYVFRGRTDSLIKTRGYRVEPGEVELALLSCAGVDRAAVVAVPDPAIGHRLVGFVSPRDGHALELAALRAQLAARVPAYMVPDPIHIRDVLPHTSTGKVDRKALRAELVAAS